MNYPPFYDSVQSIILYDPLSDFLGAIENGKVEVNYIDCVKLAGHSCPTVAGAYLMVLNGLKELYTDELPKRGDIEVSMRDAEVDGVTGVICSVISFVVGANGAGGFKGLNGNMSRNNLVSYSVPMDGEVTLKRKDTNESVTLSYNASMIGADPMMQPLMGKAMQGLASDDEKKEFGRLWQSRVEDILLSTELWNSMLTITKG